MFIALTIKQYKLTVKLNGTVMMIDVISDDGPSQKKRESKAEKLVPEQPVVSAAKPSAPEKHSDDVDTLLTGDLVSDVKQTEKPATQPAIELSTSTTAATPAQTPSVESFGIPSLIIDVLPNEPSLSAKPIQQPNTLPFVPPIPVLIIEPNQPPLGYGVKHSEVPIVIVTPSPPQTTTPVAETNPTETIATTTIVSPTVEVQTTTTKPAETSTQQATTTQASTTPSTTTTAAPIEVPHSSTTAHRQIESSSSVATVSDKTTEEVATKISVPDTTTEKFEKPESIEPIIIQDLIPVVNESPISALLKVVEEIMDKSQPIVGRAYDEDTVDEHSRSTAAPLSTELNDVTPPRPKAFIRSINAKKSTVADLGDMLYKFNYTAGFHGHNEQGDMDGAKNGEYFIIGRDNIMRTVKYTASKHGFVPSIRFGAVDVVMAPKPETEKEFGMRGYEFEWFMERSTKPKNAV